VSIRYQEEGILLMNDLSDRSAFIEDDLQHLKQQRKQTRAVMRRWQNRLLPVMTRMVIGLTLFFFVASLLQLLYLNWNISRGPSLDPKFADAILTFPSEPSEQWLTAFRYQAAVMLELQALEQRYHQTNMALMSRVWLRYLGFVTGMILALLGAVFILGKLEAPSSVIEGQAGDIKYQLRSASPGIILASLGMVLMITTIVTHQRIELEIRPLYTPGLSGPSAVEEQGQKPPLKPPLQRPENSGAGSG
jgi:hypothetical protein